MQRQSTFGEESAQNPDTSLRVTWRHGYNPVELSRISSRLALTPARLLRSFPTTLVDSAS